MTLHYLRVTDNDEETLEAMATLLQVMINKHKSDSAVTDIIQNCGLETMADIDNSKYRFAILIEPAMEQHFHHNIFSVP